MISTDLSVWMFAILIIMTLTIVWRENILFRFTEHTYIAITAAISFVGGMVAIQKNAITPLMTGNYPFIIYIILGLLLFTRFFTAYRWLSRWSLITLMTVTLAIQVRASISSSVVDLLVSTAKMSKTIWTNPSNIVFILAMTFVMLYFIFTLHKVPVLDRIMPYSTKIGRIFLMAYFGTQVGLVYNTRIAGLVAAAHLLFMDWLGLGP